MEQKYSIDQKNVQQQIGGRKISFRKLNHHFRCNSQMYQLPVDLFDQVLRHVSLAHGPGSQIRLGDDKEPIHNKQRWKVGSLKGKGLTNLITEKKACRKKMIRPIDRHSYENKNKISVQKGQICQKFPSQKALLPKQKLMPVTINEKEKSQIQIFRMVKDNFTTQLLENSRQHDAFLESQAQKFKNCQESRCLNNIAFNYDGSIMPLALVKKIKKQVIECNCLLKQQTVIQPLNLAYKQASQVGVQGNQDAEQNYKKIDQIGPEYVKLFEKIKWHPKITILNNQKPDRDSFIKEKKSVKSQNGLIEINSRFNDVQIKKKALDNQSVVKVANPQAYYQQLLIIPSRTNHKRSISHDCIDVESEIKNQDLLQNSQAVESSLKKRGNLSYDCRKQGYLTKEKRSETCVGEKKESLVMYRKMDRSQVGVECYKKRFQKGLRKKRKKTPQNLNK